MIIGAIAQWILGQTKRGGGVDWAMALIAGLVGSFVGGLLASLIAGDGLAFKPSGIIGSLVGAIIVLLIWGAVERSKQKKEAASRKVSRSGDPRKRAHPGTP